MVAGSGLLEQGVYACEKAHERKVELLWELVKIPVPGPLVAH